MRYFDTTAKVSARGCMIVVLQYLVSTATSRIQWGIICYYGMLGDLITILIATEYYQLSLPIDLRLLYFSSMQSVPSSYKIFRVLIPLLIPIYRPQ
jgi:hypothetical protein